MGPGEQSSLALRHDPNAATLPSVKVRCDVWGVLNATPDSFSDGGRFIDTRAALVRAEQMLREGANVIDVGGESSRPAGPAYGAGGGGVSLDEELVRVVPIVAAIRRDFGARVSVDTTKAEVARQAIEAGASVVNDVSCGASTELLDVVARTGVELVLMHTRSRGEISPENTRYDDLVADVVTELLSAVGRAVDRGIAAERIWIDPGIGFAKTADQSMTLIAAMSSLVATGHRVLVGPSRKSFIAKVAPNHNGELPGPDSREGGTAAAVALAVLLGAHAVRVHDVAAMRQAVLVAERARDQVVRL